MNRSSSSEHTPLGFYLLERVRQLRVQHIIGVPGDFNLTFLDQMETLPDLEWIGTCNELNAAYAADGYARTSGKPAVLLTTYGVGELSALNGISGAFVENVPIIHIVGTTSRAQRDMSIPIHHAPGEIGLVRPDHLLYVECSRPFSVAHEVLEDINTATEQIDRAFNAALQYKRPTYIFLPTDMVALPVKSDRLDTPLNGSWPLNDKTGEVIEKVLRAIDNAKSIAVIGDMLALRFDLKSSIEELADKIGAVTAVTPLGKSSVDETVSRFLGYYSGATSPGRIDHKIDNMDLVLSVGMVTSDTNSGNFSRDVKPSNHIILHSHYVTVQGETYEGVHFVHVIEGVLKRLRSVNTVKTLAPPRVSKAHSGPLTQGMFVDLFTEVMKPADVLVVETCAFQPQATQVLLPHDACYIAQASYCSIGYALPAAFGSALARSSTQPNTRVALIEGDGSAQMTVQELGSIVRHKLPVTVFLLNNDGYTIERAILGEDAIYNDICPNWKWTKLFETFGAAEGDVETYTVATAEEFKSLTGTTAFKSSRKPQFVEVICGKKDYPVALTDMLAGGRKVWQPINARYSKEHDNIPATTA